MLQFSVRSSKAAYSTPDLIGFGVQCALLYGLTRFWN